MITLQMALKLMVLEGHGHHDAQPADVFDDTKTVGGDNSVTDLESGAPESEGFKHHLLRAGAGLIFPDHLSRIRVDRVDRAHFARQGDQLNVVTSHKVRSDLVFGDLARDNASAFYSVDDLLSCRVSRDNLRADPGLVGLSNENVVAKYVVAGCRRREMGGGVAVHLRRRNLSRARPPGKALASKNQQRLATQGVLNG